MSAVKRKLNNTKLIKKCQIIREVEKGMTNKEASEKYGVPKISTWMKNKEKLLQGHNISLKTIGGEFKSVTPQMTCSWNETTLPTILSNYKLEDIFNADEFGLFYQCLPNKTYHFKGEKCSGGKKSKVRFTGMAAASAKGEKMPMFVIGKSKSARCFKNIKHLPTQYISQKKSWMSSEIFEEWVRKVDRKFRVDGRKIALIIDNCPAHPTLSNLTNVQLVFLPPNTTSTLQPMDQCVIRSLKAYYRGKVARLISRALEEKKALSKDINSARNEVTGRFLGTRIQRNHCKLF
ncbi:tigger transposable element-derived protein 4-like [Penaeus indicus]|uniref:tigger transposable element-derived protein 4-like n=1 Tax=Penaeus indicus TaxID=29960 RepID=UPI00300C5925